MTWKATTIQKKDEYGEGPFVRSAWMPTRGRCYKKLSPIEFLLQYRFATPKPLKTRPLMGSADRTAL